MKKLLYLLLMTLSTEVFSGEVHVDVRCFSSPNKSISLELRIYTDNEIGWVGGQVRYKQSEQFIPLILDSTESVQDIPGRPSEFKHIWLEIIDGNINGEYHILSQGAVIYGFTYINKKNNKTIDLSQESVIDESGACTWQLD